MSGEFIGKEIEVTTSDDIKSPVSFRLEGRDYKIAEILESWPDYGYGNNPPKRKRWYHRRHRNYFRVKTTDGEVYEMYYDRGTKLEHPEFKTWFLTRKL
jgi:hypothetical protein